MPIHRGNKWAIEEDDRLRELIAAKTSVTLISAKLNRSPEAIRMRILAVCTENLIRVDDVMESPKLAE